MSTCISRHGEYGEHTPTEGDPFTCEWCGVEDTDAMRALVDELHEAVRIERNIATNLEYRIEELRAEVKRLTRLLDLFACDCDDYDGWHTSHRFYRWIVRAEAAEAALAKVRDAVAEHPDPCPEVDSEAGISCGWKRAFQDVRAALEDPA